MSDPSTSVYSREFFDVMQETSLRSARAVVPLVQELLRPRRVIDVGCGLGTWLAVFREGGAEQVHGLDGAYVDVARLLIPTSCFQVMDLTAPQPLAGTFDLALSLEVAEHLPPSCGPSFARFLAGLAPVVLFSAAVPGQVGTNHVNPRWHDYWHAQFNGLGFEALDALRPVLWHDERVAIHYRQNIFLYARRDWLASAPEAARLRELPRANCLTLLDIDVVRANLALRPTLQRLPRLLWQSLTRRRAP